MSNNSRNVFYERNRRRQYLHALRLSNGMQLPIIPLEFYGAALAACDKVKGRLDYGWYMDSADGLGLDDVSGYDYGYDEAVRELAGFFDVALKTLKTIGSAIVTGAKFVGTNLYSGAKWAGTTFIKGAAKLPSIAKSAYKWAATSRITYPVRLVVRAGKTIGRWVYSGAKWLFQSPSGQPATPPPGVTAPQGAPDTINISPGGTSAPAGTQQVVNIGTQPAYYEQPAQQPVYHELAPQYVQDGAAPSGYPITSGSGSAEIMDAANGLPQIAPETEKPAIQPLVIAGIGLLAAFLIYQYTTN